MRLGEHFKVHRPALPVIYIHPRQPSQIVEELWEQVHFRNDPPILFRNADGCLTRIVESSPPALPRTEPVESDVLQGWAMRIANFATETKEGPRAAKPPREVIRDMLANPDRQLPQLRALVTTPVLKPDGTCLLWRPGYDPASGLYYLPSRNLEIASISWSPSSEELARAVNLIAKELFGDFPFSSPSDLAAAFALLLTPFIRHYITGVTPIFLIGAPSPGSGKGLLADTIGLIVLGAPVPVTTVGDDEGETRKKLTSLLLRGTILILIDNVRGLDSPQIAAAITAAIWSDRLLGKSKQLELPNVSIWMMTANGPALSLELARRSVRISLNSGVERPWERGQFRHPDLGGWILSNRGHLVWAVLTLVQNWIVRGRPLGTRTMGRFEDWSRTVGGILMAADIPGFLDDRDAFFEAVDPETEEWRGFVSAWWQRFGTAKLPGAKLIELALATETLSSVIGDGSTPSRLSRLGKALRANDLRIIDGLQIVGELQRHTKTRQYCLREVKP